MPKKRHSNLYSKPPSTAPASLQTTKRSEPQHGPRQRSVNQILADLRRVSLASAQSDSAAVAQAVTAPSVPPSLRRILAIPDIPGPVPRRPVRIDARGRRLPPGPAPPASWLSRSRHAPSVCTAGGSVGGIGGGGGGSGMMMILRCGHLPGAYAPGRGSLVDLILRDMVLTWDFQREYNRYYLSVLPARIRSAFIQYLTVWGARGVSIVDLHALLVAPTYDDQRDTKNENEDEDDEGEPEPGFEHEVDPATLNQDLHHLDLTGCLGPSLKLNQLTDFLFPSRPPPLPPSQSTSERHPATQTPTRKTGAAAAATSSSSNSATNIKDSWDAEESSSSSSSSSSSFSSSPLFPAPPHLSSLVNPLPQRRPPPPPQPPSILPTLTHLSLATHPFSPSSTSAASWKHLSSLATHLPNLTHLSLAYWPEPCLTPNARNASVVSPHHRLGSIAYSATGPYSHSLDDDWSESLILLRRLAKSLYRLEWLDLTGCGTWAPHALTRRAEHDEEVDWVGDWGKIETVVLYSGMGNGGVDVENSDAAIWRSKIEEHVRLAELVERHIRAKRAGRGRFITVERDAVDR